MKILIGVDDSPHSRAAVEYVRTMSWPGGSEIKVLSILQPVFALYSLADMPMTPPPASPDDEQIRYHQEMAAKAERALQSAGLATEARILTGDPRTELVEAAIAEKADLLIVGSHGRTGMAKLLMGSVASYVVTHAPCSVLVVRLAPGAKT